MFFKDFIATRKQRFAEKYKEKLFNMKWNLNL